MTNSNPKPAHKPANINPSQRTLPPDWVETTATDLFNALNEDDQQQDLRHSSIQPVIQPASSIPENAASKLVYPWNPTTDASNDFFNAVDHADNADLLNSFTASELDEKATNFFNGLDQLWDQSLQTTLARKFATVPAAMLAQIAAQATQIAKTSTELLDQLTTCVQSVLPEWALEDLQVLARPMAYAMRGDGAEPTTKDWAELSATEQAKLTLAIAHYALKQLQD
jgi:hypothetical protein